MSQPFTVNASRFDPYKTLPLPGLLRHQHDAGRGRQQGRGDQALRRRDRVQGGRQRHHPQGTRPARSTSRSRSSAASPTTTDFEAWANAGSGARQGLAEPVAEEPPPGDPDRAAQRGGTAGAPLPRPPRVGVGVPGAARPRRRHERDRHRAHQARERGLGARPLAVGARRSSDPCRGLRSPVPRTDGARPPVTTTSLLRERGPGLATAIALAGRRARGEAGGPLDAGALPVGDVDAIVVELRRAVLGDQLIAEGRVRCVRRRGSTSRSAWRRTWSTGAPARRGQPGGRSRHGGGCIGTR